MKRLSCALLFAAASCHSGGPGIQSFTADKTTVNSGDAVTFSWKVSGASKLTIDPDVGDVTGTTTAQAHPFATATYTLTASSGSSSSKATVNITVNPFAGAASFTATPAQAAPGDPVTLRWNVGSATSVSIAGVADNQPASGSVVINPQATTKYVLAPQGQTGPLAPLSVLVRVAAKPVITSFVVPATATQGSDVTLSWTADRATSFTLASDAGLSKFLGPLTSFTVQPTQTTSYTLTARGPTGSDTQVKQLVVAQTPGSTFLWTPAPGPLAPSDLVELRGTCPAATPPSSTPPPCTQITFDLVAAKAITADSLALNLPIPGASRVALHLAGSAPDFTFNASSGIDPGSNPPAAAIALPQSGPLARVLTLGLAQKAAGSGAVTSPKSIAVGTTLATFKLDLVPAGGTGLVFSPQQPPTFVLRAAGVPQGTLAIGTLRVQ